MVALVAMAVSSPAMAQPASPAPAKPSLMTRMKAAVHSKSAPAKPAPNGPAHTSPAVSPAGHGRQPRTAKSLASSRQADAKNIHGQARKNFMSHCKKA
jgi:hypothetical protein